MELGTIDWTPNQRFDRGLYVRSVCARCNNQCGYRYGGAYVDLVRRVAERIGDVQDFHSVSILGVKRPLAILKHIPSRHILTPSNPRKGGVYGRQNAACPGKARKQVAVLRQKATLAQGIDVRLSAINGKV